MELIKLTLKQAQDLEQALDDWNYDKSVLVRMHYEKKVNKQKWINYPELNHISYYDLEKALYEGYEIKQEIATRYSLKELNEIYYKQLNEKIIEEKSSKEKLEADLDYHLKSLHLALKDSDFKEVEYLKRELSKIVEKLEVLD